MGKADKFARLHLFPRRNRFVFVQDKMHVYCANISAASLLPSPTLVVFEKTGTSFIPFDRMQTPYLQRRGIDRNMRLNIVGLLNRNCFQGEGEDL